MFTSVLSDSCYLTMVMSCCTAVWFVFCCLVKGAISSYCGRAKQMKDECVCQSGVKNHGNCCACQCWGSKDAGVLVSGVCVLRQGPG